MSNEDARSASFQSIDLTVDDEEVTNHAGIDKLPANYNRIRNVLLETYDEEGKVVYRQVDVGDLGPSDRQMLMDKLVQIPEEDNEKFLQKIRRRVDSVGITLPTVEVRFENLKVEAECFIGGRALPTLWNTARNVVEGLLELMHLFSTKRTRMTILRDISGIIKPSRITLLLGPPGCGKSTLLQALAGKLDQSLKVKGNITYNGHQLDEFVPQKTSGYVSQYDLHIGEMTTRETLEFSARCQGVGTRYELLMELAEREEQAGIFPDTDIDTFIKATSIEGLKGSLQADYTLKILGLDVCADTIIGDAMQRGISGGQRKRVTTGETMVGPTNTLFMDDISSGLDSSTTFQIVKCLQQVVHILEGTILISLLQPAPETFDLFDDIILMSEGQIVYQGPREDILEFFASCGFRCPERKAIADFLQEVTSRKDQEQYWVANEMPYQYVSVKQFAEKFKQFNVGQKLINELSTPYDKSGSHKAALSFSRYSISKIELLKACFNREWLLMKRNSFLYVFMSAQLVVVAFIAMSVFIRTRMKIDALHGNYYLGALFFSLIITMFNGYAEIAMTMARLPVFFKQRDLLFYPAWAYTIPTFVLKIPLSLLESFLWTAISYYVIGFAPEVSRFFGQFFVLFFLHQMSSSLFRLIAGLCRTMVIANTGAFIPNWWIWGYWISPLAYAETAITVNEFLAPRWEKPYSENTTIGLYVLESHGLFSKEHFYWIGLGALAGFTFLFNLLLTIALTYLNPIGKPRAVISEEKLTEIQANQQDVFVQYQNMQFNPIQHGSPPHVRESTNSDDVRANISSESGITKHIHEITNSLPRISANRGMILPFQPLAISFMDVQYFVDMPEEMKALGASEKRLQLLKDLTGAFRPGILTALMGVSGAGKTTLMDVLSGRKTGGYIEGDIRISGFPKVQQTFARVSGYCEQNEIHSPQITVRESLLFSAYLRLSPEIDSKSKQMFVDEVMELVELDDLRDTLVGLPSVSGLSTEQRKRLTIAVELVANPSIIFMDEPTSGLDARAAAIVMRAVRNTVDTGRTVVCTIHQPSIDIFEGFDELLLMKQGGQIIYAGPLGRNSIHVIEYFQAIHGVPHIKDKCNPATWMLEISSTAAEQRFNIDFADVYKKSPLHERNRNLVEELFTPAEGAKDLYFPTQFSQSAWAQFCACLWKQHWTYWRSPRYNLVRLFFTFIAALLFGTIYWQLGTKIENREDLFTVMGALYGATLFLGINNSSAVQSVVAVERTVFYREKAAGMYSSLPYALSQATMYGSITYSMIGFQLSALKFFWYIFTMFFTFLYFTYYGMLAVAITPSYQVSAIVASAFYNLFNLFSGFLIPRPDLPKWWQWYYWICPTSWTMDGLATSQYGDLSKEISVDGVQKPINVFLEDYFGFRHEFLAVVGAVLVIFPAFFVVLFAYAITTLNFQKR
eukprot:Gb_04571 [translate_table: standard]